MCLINSAVLMESARKTAAARATRVADRWSDCPRVRMWERVLVGGVLIGSGV